MTDAPNAGDPLAQFDAWFEEARADAGVLLPEACCLSTIDPDGYPDARMVLFKERDAGGFVFHTNYRSMKGRSLERIARAALTFHWAKLERQVRVQGDTERLTEHESDAYFATRPRGSQIGAWASAQSEPIVSRAALMDEVARLGARYEGRPIPRPPHWGGIRIVPRRIELWQGRADRLHDRSVYRRADGHAPWSFERLQP